MRSLLGLCLFLSLSAAQAAPPVSLPHTGRLFDVSGLPVSGPQDVDLALYDSDSASVPLWSDTVSGVVFDNGYFSLTLGSDTNPIDVSIVDQPTLYLGLGLAGTGEVGRQLVHSVPYALLANTALNVDGGVVNASEIQLDGVTLFDSGGFSGASLGGLSCSGGQVALFDGGAWACGSNTLDETTVDTMVSDNGYALAASLSNVATSGDYTDLNGLPTFATVATSGDYTDLNGLPTLATIATSGAYADLSGLPTLSSLAISGDWKDIANIPADFADGVDNDTIYTDADAVAAMTGFGGGYIQFGGAVNGLPTGYDTGFAPSDGATIRAGRPTGTENSTLFITTNDNTNDAVYIGGSGQQCCGGTPWLGLRVEASGNAQLSGTLSSGAGALYADVAEGVPVANDVGAGDVIAVHQAAGSYPDTRFERSAEAYDTRVVGVVSDSAILSMASGEGRLPLALSGLVKVKVDASYGSVSPGDLLVASPTPGFAMRAERMVPGAIIGKALEPLEAGSGRVLMLVMNR